MADAVDSKSTARKGMTVQVRPPAPLKNHHETCISINRISGFMILQDFVFRRFSLISAFIGDYVLRLRK